MNKNNINYINKNILNNTNNNTNNNSNKKDNDKKNRKNNFNNFSENDNETKYINHKFIRNAINKMDIVPKDVTKIEVGQDGNCLMGSISLFKYKNENLHIKIRKEITDYLEIHKEELKDFLFETEKGLLNID